MYGWWLHFAPKSLSHSGIDHYKSYKKKSIDQLQLQWNWGLFFNLGVHLVTSMEWPLFFLVEGFTWKFSCKKRADEIFFLERIGVSQALFETHFSLMDENPEGFPWRMDLPNVSKIAGIVVLRVRVTLDGLCSFSAWSFDVL